MSMTYRTRRRLQRIGTVSLIALMVFVIFWFCWVLFLERHIVYTRDDGAVLDMEINANEQVGQVAKPPSSGGTGITIYYNEGDNAIEVTNELAQLDGYYISADMLINDLAGVWEDLEHLSSGTPVMIELKGGYGSFYYNSSLADAITSQSVSVDAVDGLIQELKKQGFYTIARVSAFRDYNYGLNHVNIGLPFVGKQYLWADEGGCYWLNPTSPATLSWISSIVTELRDLGFHEVMLADFRFPASDKYTFNGDKNAALLDAANSLLDSCGSYDFVLSFCVDDASFALPDSRSRLYLEGVSAATVGVKVSQATITNPEVRLVFLAQTNDTRYSDYGCLRPIDVAEALEAQKAAEQE